MRISTCKKKLAEEEPAKENEKGTWRSDSKEGMETKTAGAGTAFPNTWQWSEKKKKRWMDKWERTEKR